jgi:ABC-type uncharacterized transport system substrate-binding protein
MKHLTQRRETMIGSKNKMVKGIFYIIVYLLCNVGVNGVAKDNSIYLSWWLKLPMAKGQFNQGWQREVRENDDLWVRINPRYPSSAPVRRILVLFSKPSSSYNNALAEFLHAFRRARITVQLTVINFKGNLDLGRSAVLAAEKSGIELIVAMGSDSTAFIFREYRQNAERTIPVVTTICKDPVIMGQWQSADKKKPYGNNPRSRIACTSLNIPLDLEVEYLMFLKPNLKNVGLLYNKQHKQVMKTEIIPTIEVFSKRRIRVIEVFVDVNPSDEVYIKEAAVALSKKVPAAITQMKAYDKELKDSIFWVSSCTSIFDNLETINRYSGHVPVLGSNPTMVKSNGKKSAVIAIGIDRRSNARLAANYAIDILKGIKKTGDLEVGIVTPPDLAIQFNVARKIGLKVPFFFYESASFVYDYDGKRIISFGNDDNK